MATEQLPAITPASAERRVRQDRPLRLALLLTVAGGWGLEALFAFASGAWSVHEWRCFDILGGGRLRVLVDGFICGFMYYDLWARIWFTRILEGREAEDERASR